MCITLSEYAMDFSAADIFWACKFILHILDAAYYICRNIVDAPPSFLRVCDGLFGSQQRQLTALNSSKVPLTKKNHTLARFAFVLHVCMCYTRVFVRQSYVRVLSELYFVKTYLLPKTRQFFFSKKRPLSENRSHRTK